MGRNDGIRQDPEKLKELLSMRREKKMKLKEVGKHFGISGERVRQIEKKEAVNEGRDKAKVKSGSD